MSPSYAEALDIVKTEASMMENEHRLPSVSVYWLNRAIKLLEGDETE